MNSYCLTPSSYVLGNDAGLGWAGRGGARDAGQMGECLSEMADILGSVDIA